EREIRRFTLKAPYDGQLLSWMIRAGDYINVGKKVAVIADTSRYLFHGSLANADRLLMRKGQQAYLSLKNYPHQKYGYLSAEVLRIETVIDDQSQQSKHHVWLTVTPPEIRLYPGLQGIAYVTTFRGTIFDYLIRGADPHYIPHHQRPPSNP
ncbi:MAG: HlyD family secretion protein, partial [Lentisphaerae bacterium]